MGQHQGPNNVIEQIWILHQNRIWYLFDQLQESSALIQFLQQQNFDQLALSTELAEQLIDKTEGWFTGIQFTNLYLKEHQDIHGFIQNLSGAHHQIVNYLSEQVFYNKTLKFSNSYCKLVY
jgi:ATP/maltotriose-dependent transcriptional regulator MalT